MELGNFMKKGEPFSPKPNHGTRARYISRYYRCSCKKCKEANDTYIKDYRIRRKNNGGFALTKSRNPLIQPERK